MSTYFGAYLQSLSTSVAWGGEGGSCQLTIVEDPENGVYANIPAVGSYVSVSYGRFYFGGILQRWTYKESLSGKTYDLSIESPAKLLDGIQVIVSEFNGTNYSSADPFNPSSGPLFTNQIVNVYNTFAYRENYQSDIGGGGYFGAANVNSAGAPALTVLNDVAFMAQQAGNSIFGGPAQFGGNYFAFDFSELTSYLNVDFRISGPVQSLSSIIQECAEAVGVEYFVRVNGGGNGPAIIKIETVYKDFQPNPMSLRGFINEQRNNGTLVSSSVGKEFSAPVTQKLVIGGPASRFFTLPISKTIPLWGKTSNNLYVYERSLSNTIAVYNDPTFKVPILLDEYSNNISYQASIFELRMATGGKDSWETFKTFETLYGVESNGYNNMFTAPWIGKIEASDAVFQLLSGGMSTGIDFEPTSFSSAQKRALASLQNQSDKIFAAVSRVANQFYGQVFLAELPYYEPAPTGGTPTSNNIRFIRQDVQYESQWDISESAFVADNPFADVTFYDGDGRLKGGAAFPSQVGADYSALGSDWAITPDGGIATTKGGPDKDVYWLNDVPYVIVRSGGQVRFVDGVTTPDFGLSVLFQLFAGVFPDPSLYLSGGQNAQVAIPPAITYPTSFGIPQQSNTYSWGPWYRFSGSAPAQTEVVVDESLVPETFGSSQLLDNAAFALAGAGLANSVENETGTVEVAGQPAFNIADRLQGSGPYVSGMDLSVGVDGTKTTYKFSSWSPQFGRMAKTNIDRIAKIRKGSLALAQRNRSKIQKKPLPKINFEKSDIGELAEKFKRPSVNMFHSYINEVFGANTFRSASTANGSTSSSGSTTSSGSAGPVLGNPSSDDGGRGVAGGGGY